MPGLVTLRRALLAAACVPVGVVLIYATSSAVIGVVLAPLVVWGGDRLVRRLRRSVPRCPHCGARADDRYRVCSSCGRDK